MTTKKNQKKAQELREKAQECSQAARDSFERCQDDGFMSQAANQVHADLYRTQAKLLENPLRSFPGLFRREDGARMRAKLKSFPNTFAPWKGDTDKWMFLDQDGKPTGKYLPDTRTTRSKLHREGFEVRDEQAPARAEITAGAGGGLCGAFLASVTLFRDDDGYPADAVGEGEPLPEPPAPAAAQEPTTDQDHVRADGQELTEEERAVIREDAQEDPGREAEYRTYLEDAKAGRKIRLGVNGCLFCNKGGFVRKDYGSRSYMTSSTTVWVRCQACEGVKEKAPEVPEEKTTTEKAPAYSWRPLVSRDPRKKPAQEALRAAQGVTGGKVTNVKVSKDGRWFRGDVLATGNRGVIVGAQGQEAPEEKSQEEKALDRELQAQGPGCFACGAPVAEGLVAGATCTHCGRSQSEYTQSLYRKPEAPAPVKDTGERAQHCRYCGASDLPLDPEGYCSRCTPPAPVKKTQADLQRELQEAQEADRRQVREALASGDFTPVRGYVALERSGWTAFTAMGLPMATGLMEKEARALVVEDAGPEVRAEVQKALQAHSRGVIGVRHDGDGRCSVTEGGARLGGFRAARGGFLVWYHAMPPVRVEDVQGVVDHFTGGRGPFTEKPDTDLDNPESNAPATVEEAEELGYSKTDMGRASQEPEPEPEGEFLVHLPNIQPDYRYVDRNIDKKAPEGWERCVVCMNPVDPEKRHRRFWMYQADLYSGPIPDGGEWAPVGPKCLTRMNKFRKENP